MSRTSPMLLGTSAPGACWGMLAAWALTSLGPATGVMLKDLPLDDQMMQLTSTGEGFTRTIVPYHEIVFPHEQVSALPPQRAYGDLVAFAPDFPTSEDLLLWLPGSWSGCGTYSHILELAGRSLHTICLPYDNLKSVAGQCLIFDGCYRRLRMQAFNGTFNGVYGNNVRNRLVKALAYLKDKSGEVWDRYLTTQEKPAWNKIRVAGHSQGSGGSAMIGYMEKVARVVQFAGPCDHSSWPQQLAPTHTPPKRFYGFASRYDHLECPARVEKSAWRAEGALPESQNPLVVETLEELPKFELGKNHFVVSHILPPNCTMAATLGPHCAILAHDTVAIATMWPGEASPYVPVWQQLLGL